MKTLLLISALLIASGCQQKEPVKPKSNPPVESNTLLDVPDEFQEASAKELKGFICDMSTHNGPEQVFLQFTIKSNGERRLHLRKLQGTDKVEPFYPLLDAFRILPLDLEKDTAERVNYQSDAEIIHPLMPDGLKIQSAISLVELDRDGDSFVGRISVAYHASGKSVRTYISKVIAEIKNCTGSETVKMGTK